MVVDDFYDETYSQFSMVDAKVTTAESLNTNVSTETDERLYRYISQISHVIPPQTIQ